MVPWWDLMWIRWLAAQSAFSVDSSKAPGHISCNIFLHAKSWIPGGGISIFTAVIH